MKAHQALVIFNVINSANETKIDYSYITFLINEKQLLFALSWAYFWLKEEEFKEFKVLL